MSGSIGSNVGFLYSRNIVKIVLLSSTALVIGVASAQAQTVTQPIDVSSGSSAYSGDNI